MMRLPLADAGLWTSGRRSPAGIGRATRGPQPSSATAGATPRRDRDRRRPSLTLVESVVSIAIVGMMLVAALGTLGASKKGSQKTGDRAQAALLAQDLMSEILRQHYEDPDFPAGSFGLGVADIGDGSRALWDDVDDYHGWSSSPPERKDGTVIPDRDGWRRSVRVAWVSPANLSQLVVSDTRVKRITVSVSRNGVTMASLVAIRSAAGLEPVGNP